MEKTHDGRHGSECFGCRIQSVQVSPAATPSRRNKIAPRTPNNSYEKGIPTDERGMPTLLPGTFEPAGQKFVNQNRHRIEEARRRSHQAAHQPQEV